MTCEKCSAIFSKKKCLHQNCPAHRAELTAFQRKIDEHIQEMVVQAWHPRDNALEVQTPETENNTNVVSRIKSPNHHHSAQTSGNSHSPGKTEAAGDIQRNHKQLFPLRLPPPNEQYRIGFAPDATSYLLSTRSSNGRAPLLQSGGSGFDSLRAHSREQQTNTRL